MPSARRITAAAAATLAGAPSAWAQPYSNRRYGWHMDWDGWSWGHMLFGGAAMILFWGAVILLIVLLVRWLARSPPERAGSDRPAALDVLEERFARGEIGAEEFEERRRLLLGRERGRR